MDVSVATWNLNARGLPTWEILSQIGADVVLVQEARPPSGWAHAEGMTAWPPLDRPAEWVSVGTHRRWSSGIVVLNPELHLRPRTPTPAAAGEGRAGAPASVPLGTLTVADLYRGDTYWLTVASVYGMFQPIPDTHAEDSYQTMNSVLDALTPVVEDPGSRVVVGGDFNSWKHTHGLPSTYYQAVFDRFAALGMTDCIQANSQGLRNPMPTCSCGDGALCANVQTHRHNRSAAPWQNDYIYATAAVMPTLTAWDVLATDEMWAASDHCPVMATFTIEPALAAAGVSWSPQSVVSGHRCRR